MSTLTTVIQHSVRSGSQSRGKNQIKGIQTGKEGVKLSCLLCMHDFPSAATGKEPACQRKSFVVLCLAREDPLEEGMTAHSSILACRIPCTEEPGGL